MSPIPWEQKLPIAFWRGTDRGAVNWDAALDASKLELQRTFCYRAAKAIEVRDMYKGSPRTLLSTFFCRHHSCSRPFD